MATYTNLRPEDLRRITERDYRDGIIRFERPTKKKNRGKLVQLIDEHNETWKQRLKSKHAALPYMPFFRHHNQSGVANDSLYGKDLFYKWWKKACMNLGIEGVDLYGEGHAIRAQPLQPKTLMKQQQNRHQNMIQVRRSGVTVERGIRQL